MKCQRCLGNEEATYRVYSDEMDMKVCAGCAEEAQKIGISVEFLASAGRRPLGISTASEATRV
jgi:hypothetical protein